MSTMTTTCAHCGGSIGLPHLSEVDCVRGLDREMAATVRQLRALNTRRSLLLRARTQRASASDRRPGDGDFQGADAARRLAWPAHSPSVPFSGQEGWTER